MTLRPPNSRIAGLTAAILVGALGCAPSALHSPLLQPQGGTQPRTIGVVSARFAPTASYPTPDWRWGKAAAIGAGKGAFVTLVACAYTYGLGCFLAPIIIPAGMAIEVHDTEPPEIKRDNATLKAALAELEVQENLRDGILALTAAQTGYSFVSVPDHGPKSDGEIVSYRSLATQGIDLVLEVSVQEIELRPLRGAGERPGDPALALAMTAHARLIAVPDDRVLAVHSTEYSHEPAAFVGTFAEWASNDAQALRNERARATQSLAASIGVHLLGIPASTESAPQATPVE